MNKNVHQSADLDALEEFLQTQEAVEFNYLAVLSKVPALIAELRALRELLDRLGPCDKTGHVSDCCYNHNQRLPCFVGEARKRKETLASS